MSILQSWDALLQEEFQKEYYMALQSRLDREYEQYTVYPPREYLYEAFMQAPWEQVKVVILGQDPYHGYGQAHGLCFSVPAGVQIPPSLRNIYQELHTDLGFAIPNHGDLHKWARQGVLLLNTTFSVRDGEANSHKGFGWERLTDEVIRQISEQKENVVFILWGKPAQQKAKGIDASKHLVLMAPHPSPLSSYRGFFGSKPFSKTNSYLEAHGVQAIDWEIEMC